MIAKTLVGVLLIAGLLFAALIIVLYINQRSLIYPIPAYDADTPAGFERIEYTTSDGLRLQAGYRSGRDGKPVLLFFHGNGVDWQTTSFTTELAMAQGYGVLAAEYRGYGGNPGSPSETGLYRDGFAAYTWLRDQGIAPSDIVLVGNSLGSGVATEIARNVDARALMIVSGFKSMSATAANAYPFAPVDALLHDRFDNIDKLPELEMPILVVHGADDSLIPVAHARALAAANPAAELVVLSGMGHNMSGETAAQRPQLAFLRALEDAR